MLCDLEVELLILQTIKLLTEYNTIIKEKAISNIFTYFFQPFFRLYLLIFAIINFLRENSHDVEHDERNAVLY